MQQSRTSSAVLSNALTAWARHPTLIATRAFVLPHCVGCSVITPYNDLPESLSSLQSGCRRCLSTRCTNVQKGRRALLYSACPEPLSTGKVGRVFELIQKCGSGIDSTHKGTSARRGGTALSASHFHMFPNGRSCSPCTFRQPCYAAAMRLTAT
jgi:hypothetical protein